MDGMLVGRKTVPLVISETYITYVIYVSGNFWEISALFKGHFVE